MQLYLTDVVAALAAKHGVAKGQEARLKAVITNLQKRGLPLPESRAKGARAEYHPAEIARIAFALELREAGLSRDATVLTTLEHWPDMVEQAFAGRADPRQLRYLVARPRMLEGVDVRLKPVVGLDEITGFITSRFNSLLMIECTRFFERLVEAFGAAGLDVAALEADLDEAQPIILEKGARIYTRDMEEKEAAR